MQVIIKIFIIFSSIYWTSGKINLITDSHVDMFNKIVINILTNCYSELKTVLVYGYHGENLVTHFSGLPKYPVILNYNSSVTNDRVMYIEIDLLIIAAESMEEFPDVMMPYNDILLPIKSLFMFYYNNEYFHCDDWLPHIFQLPLEYDIPSAYRFCIDDNNDYQIETYNPYKTYAPFQWEKKVRWIFEGDIGSPLTGYTRNYTKEYATSIAAGKCQNFDFDRTKNIDGYKIIAAKLRNTEVEKEIQNPRKKLIYEKRNYPENTVNLTFYERELATAIQQTLNVSLVFPYEGFNNEVSSSFTDVIKANSAFLAFLPFNYHYYISWISVFNPIDLSYPITMVSDVIVTHNRELAPPLAQINNSYVRLMAISILVMMLITFIVIYSSAKINNDRLSFACFECLRLLMRNRLSTQMDTLKVRMFFFMVFIYFLLMIEIFSGYLTAFSIKPKQQKNAETTDDLLDPRYKTIYLGTNIYYYYEHPTFKKFLYETECENFIKNNESVACINYDIAVKYINIAYDLHISKKSVSNFFTIPMRRLWPLRMRIDNVIMRLVQSGITDKWYDTLMRHQFTMLRTFDDHIVGGHYYRTLSLDDLMVAFVLLVSGLMLSVIIFIIEIIWENDFIHDIILGKYDDIYM